MSEKINATKVFHKLRDEKIPVNYDTAQWADKFEHRTLKNKDGTPLRCKRNGKTKTWKRKPDQFSIPVKHGLKEYFNLDNKEAGNWYIPD